MNYPKISDDIVVTLKVLQSNVREAGGGYFRDPRCPYSPMARNFFESLFGTDGQGAVGSTAVKNLFVNDDGDGEEDDVAFEMNAIDSQIQTMLSQLVELGATKLEIGEKLQLLKTQAQLTEKLVAVRERVVNLRAMNEFKAQIVSGLEEICTIDQINQFHKLLGTFKTANPTDVVDLNG